MKEEFSAGGVVFRKDSGQSQNDIFILVSQHSQHHGWVFPKGFIGDKIAGESKEETALREVKEETGVVGKILEPLTPITYWYEMDGQKHPKGTSYKAAAHKKTVYYYIMEYVSGNIEDHDWEMEAVEWLKPEEVLDRLTYESDKQVWQEAQKRILSLVPSYGGD